MPLVVFMCIFVPFSTLDVTLSLVAFISVTPGNHKTTASILLTHIDEMLLVAGQVYVKVPGDDGQTPLV